MTWVSQKQKVVSTLSSTECHILSESNWTMEFTIGNIENNKRFYIETYGCQMNFADTEVVNAILLEAGLRPVQRAEDADVVLLNTCAIRENAESKIWNRLKELRGVKKQNRSMTVGVLGCMAERIKEKVIEREHLVDLAQA
jgi:2-methylthioadenine synthetase